MADTPLPVPIDNSPLTPYRLLQILNFAADVLCSYGSQPMTGFNFVDGIVAAILLVGIADGARRGLSGEVATLVATAASGLAAWKFSGWAREMILRNTAFTAKEATVAGVVAVFVIAYIVLFRILGLLALRYINHQKR